MHRRFTLIALFATLGLAVAVALAQPDRTDQQRMPRTGGMGQIDVNMDEDFVKNAASENQFEIQLGEIIQQRAQDQEIKQFAQRVIDEHRQANDRLKQVAQQMNVQISEQLNPVHQAKLQHYQQKQGRELELSYIFSQAGSHVKDVLVYQFMSENAKNPQLKQYASQTLPKLREHLQTALRIAPGGDEARLAGERIGPNDRPDQPDQPGRPGQPGQPGENRDR